MRGWVLLSLSLMLTGVWADDDEPLVPDRPNVTNTTFTLAPGKVELEGGYAYSSSGGEIGHSLGQLNIRAGVTRRIDAHVLVDSYNWLRDGSARAEGLGDLNIGCKWRFADKPSKPGWGRPGLALLVATDLPTGRSGIGNTTPQPSLTLAADLDLSSRLYLAANVGLAAPRTDGKRFGQLNVSVSPAWLFTDKLGAYAEVYAEIPANGGARACYLDGGLTYTVNSSFALDTIIGQGFNGARRGDFFIGLGGAWRSR